MTKQISFANYGKQFQETLAQLVLEDRPFADQVEEVLDISFFELKYLRIFVGKLFEYRKKYGVHPTKKIVATVLRTELEIYSAAVQKQVRDYFARICIRSIEDERYIKETSLDFCKKQKLKEALMTSVDLIQNSSYDEVRKVIDDALRLGTDNDFGHEFLKDFELRYEIKARNPVATGWEKVDSIMKMGLGTGELGVVIAPTGAGKSMALAHLGAQALKAGKNVVHYTLELSESVTGHRYDSCISSVPLSTLFARKDEVLEIIGDVEGSLIIKEYPTKTASVNTIKNHLEKLKKRNHKIDMIIVDYADLLRPARNFREKREELGSIYEDLRAVAQENKCPIWTASQTNRTGLNAEVVTMESISEAFNKCFVADFIFSISRTIQHKNTNGGRMFVAKNRNGPDGLVYPIFMDTANVKIDVLPQIETYDVIKQNEIKKQEESLKEKYKNYRKKRNK